jgi:predicted alpha/beta hydrolase family esterase
MMPTTKQRRAARRNIKNAALAAKPRKAARKLTKKTPTALGKQANKVKGRIGQVLFVQGGGRDVHDSWDNKLVASLKKELGAGYAIHYPRMPNEADPDPTAWKKAIDRQLRKLSDGVILVGHSIGAAMLIDYLADGNLERRPSGVFLIATPFIGDRGWPSDDLRPTKELACLLSDEAPLYLYHGRDDETVPFSHVGMFAKALPHATIRRFEGRDHQLNDNLSELAHDIWRLR